MSKAKSGFGNINGKKGKIVVAVLSLVLLSAAITMMWSVEGQVHNTHNIQGYVTYEDGTPIGNALVNITIINSSNGQIRGWVLNTTDSTVNIGYYQVDIGNSQGGWDAGDTIYGYAEFNGFGGNNSTIAPAIVYAATPQWLNITIGAPRTNKTIGDPKCGTGLFVTSDTEFNFTAQDAPHNASGEHLNATHYRIWHNGWSDWMVYDGNNFTLDQGEGLYYIEFYSDDTLGHKEVVHNQTHYVDDTPPEHSIEFGSPTTTTPYGGNEYTMIKPCTPVWINATDGNETYPGSGASYMTISVGVSDSPYGPFQDLPQYDNFTFDQDLDGNLSIELHLQEGCFHKVVIRIWDCLGNYAGEIKEYFAVDATPPTVTKEIGNPHYGGIYGNYTWVNFSTPFWINATDDGCNGGAGAWYVWWNITVYNETTGHYEWVGNETVYDGEEGKDLDGQVNGEVHAKLTFQEECLHELHYGAVDYVGNEISWEQFHYVDDTPPAVNKTIPKIIKLEQAEWNDSAIVTTMGDDLQSFLAPWSYIDAVSIYVCGYFDPDYPPVLEIFNETFGILAYGYPAEIPVNETNYYCGWLQFHLTERLYTDVGSLYWLGIIQNQSTGYTFYWLAYNGYYDGKDKYPDGCAIVDGMLNTSWDFTFKIEYYPVYPYYNGYMYAFINSSVGTIENVAIFKDNEPWSITPDPTETILTSHGISYTVFNSSDIGNVDLSNYDKVIISSDQTDSFYDAVESHLDWFEDYAANGGQLEIHAADNAWHNGNWSIMPGGFTHYEGYYNTTDIAIQGHPILIYPNVITDDELDYWYYSTHGYFLDGLPGGSKVVLTTNVNGSNEPVFVISPWGDGCIMITTQTLEWAYNNGDSVFLENVLLYCPLPMDYLDYTWITSEAFFNLSFWDEGCWDGEKHGVGEDTLEYRIWNESDGWSEWKEYTGEFNIPDECKHYIEIRARDKLGNTRIINQTHYVDNSPPEIDLLLPYCEYHYNATEDKEYLQAGVNITLLLHDEPECAVGIRDDEIFFRYEYTNYTRWWEPEKHPVNETEIHPIYGEPVYRYGEWWWHTNETMINISFDEECNHTLYYFYDASDWLDNSNIITIYNRTFYVDNRTPVVNKTHPSHGYYHENGTLIFHPDYWINPLHPEPRNGTWIELCPNYNHRYYLVDFDDNDNAGTLTPDDYVKLINMTTGKAEWYHVINTTITLYVYNETMDEYKYIEYDGYDYFEAIFAPNGTWWKEVWPALCEGCVHCDGYQITNWTDNEDGWLDFCDYINLTNVTTTTRWHVENISLDITVEHVDYLKKCAKIELEATDSFNWSKEAFEKQWRENCFDYLELPTVLGGPSAKLWDSQSFMVNEGTNFSALDIMTLVDESANVFAYIYKYDWKIVNITYTLEEGIKVAHFICTKDNVTKNVTIEEIKKDEANLTEIAHGENETTKEPYPHNLYQAVQIHLNRTCFLTNDTLYFISMRCDKEYALAWYFLCNGSDYYRNVTCGAILNNKSQYGRYYDWMFKAERIVSTEPCASGIQGIYWRYEYNGVSYPTMEEWDNGTTVVNFNHFWDPDAKEFVNYYPDEPNITNYLWYVYDGSKGIHFYEECRHDLYYWAKDNVCHHTPIYHQVYFVDDTLPVVEKTHPDHGYYEPLNQSFEYCFLPPGWWNWSYAWKPDLGELWLNNTDAVWNQTTWENRTKWWSRYDGNYAAYCKPYDEEVEGNTTLYEQYSWLITPQIILPAEATLTFHHRANYTGNDTLPNYLLITTADVRQKNLNRPEDFDGILDADPNAILPGGWKALKIFQPNAIPSDYWLEENINLSTYAGKPVYIAWVYHSKVGHFNVSINETTNKTYRYGETWYIDKVRITPAYLRCCAQINLTADDYPPEKTIDQQQIDWSGYYELNLEGTIYGQSFIPTYPVLDAVQVALWSPNCANVTVYIYNDSISRNPLATPIASSTKFLPPQGTPDDPVWVQFHFNPPVILIPGNTYFIFVEADSPYYWFHVTSDYYANGTAWWWTEESLQSFMWDFTFKTEYYNYGCVAGLEGIYWGYYYNGTWYPTNDEEGAPEVVNISINATPMGYYNDSVIANEFYGHYLWYIYNESKGIHFYEECRHDLYYWAKDNVCHHTPVYHQVYYVDNSPPKIDIKHPDCGYRKVDIYRKADIAFIIDTSESMTEEWKTLDSKLSDIIEELQENRDPDDINITIYAIKDVPEDYSTTNMSQYLKYLTVVWYNGQNVSVDDIPNTNGGQSGDREAWAPAAAWVAQFHPWRNETNLMKIIVVISDEHAYNGRPSELIDWEAVNDTKQICADEDVIALGLYSTAIESEGEGVLPGVREQMENLSGYTISAYETKYSTLFSLIGTGIYNLSDSVDLDNFTTDLNTIIRYPETRTYLRMGATIWINATDMPDNECAAGLAGIYWRYVYNGTSYPTYNDYLNWTCGIRDQYPSNIDGIVYMFGHYWYVDTDGKIGISFNEECIHTLYWFAKDTVCHNTTIYNEIYYVDGTPPVTKMEDENMTTNCTKGPTHIGGEGYGYWQACDWINISFNVENPGTEPCKYPELVLNETGEQVAGIYTFVRYERKIWNDSMGDFEIIKYPSSASDELPEWANGIEEWFGEYWYNISITKYINITENCNHTIYYFSKDPLCNTEEVNTTEVHIDDEPPKTTHEFDPAENVFESKWANKIIYIIGKNTDIYLNAEDFPIGCASGINYTQYRVWKYNISAGNFNIDLTNGTRMIHSTQLPFEIDLSNLINQYNDEHGTSYTICGAYEIWYNSTDNCCHREDKNLFDIIVDCLPPSTTKEFAGQFVKGKVEGINATFIGRDTIIWLNATDSMLAGVEEWRSGVDKIYWRIVNETIDRTFNATNLDNKSKDYPYPVSIADLIDLLGLKDDRYDFFHWAVDRAGNEEPDHHKQWIIIDLSPPNQTLDKITPYKREVVPFNITGEVKDYGPYGGVGIDKVEIYYRYSQNNQSWGELHQIDPAKVTLDEKNQTVKIEFDAPEGPGFYRFYSNAIDKLGNEEGQSTYVWDYEAECEVIADTEPPVVDKEDGGPKVEINMGGEPIFGLSWSTPIYVNVTDMPDAQHATGVKVLKIAFTPVGLQPDSGDWHDIPKESWTVIDGGTSGYYKIGYKFTPADYESIAGLQEEELYTLFVYAADNRSHDVTAKTQKFWIDGTPPATTIAVDCSNEMPFNVTVTADDKKQIDLDEDGIVDIEISLVKNITLFYKYSSNNITWTDWIRYDSIENADNHTWAFSSDYGYGYYRFYVYAEDKLGNSKYSPSELSEDYYEAWCYIEYPKEDLNQDGKVNALDLIRIVDHWGETGEPGWIPEDLGGSEGSPDGVIDVWDIIQLVSKWTG